MLVYQRVPTFSMPGMWLNARSICRNRDRKRSQKMDPQAAHRIAKLDEARNRTEGRWIRMGHQHSLQQVIKHGSWKTSSVFLYIDEYVLYCIYIYIYIHIFVCLIVLSCLVLSLYCIVLYYTISYYVILYYVIFYYITLYHITSYHITSYHILLYYIILYYNISYYIILYYIILYYIVIFLYYI